MTATDGERTVTSYAAPGTVGDGPLAGTLSIVIITRNRRSELCRSLDRLLGLAGAPGIIVVDNGSSDGTAEAVRARYPGVSVLAAGRNLGGAGRNLGVILASTPYVAFCDDDTWWDDGGLSHAVRLMESHPRLAVLTGRILIEPGGEDDPVCWDMAHSPLPVPADLPGRPLVSFLAGASVVRRDAFLAAGGFEPRLLIGGEEELLAVDLISQGWALSYVPDVTVHHQASTARDPHLRRRQGIRNTLWFAWLRRPALSATRRTVALARSVPRDRVSVQAFLEALAGAPWVARARRVVPSEVEEWLQLMEPTQAVSRARRYVS